MKPGPTARSSRARPKRIVALCMSGIGNAVLFTPTLERLRQRMPQARIVVLVRTAAIGEVFQENRDVDEVQVLSARMSWRQRLAVIRGLRKPDIVITSFPSNKVQYNVLAFLIGGRLRVTHGYPYGGLRTLAFLQNRRVPISTALHDVEQNLALLDAVRIEAGPARPRLKLPLGPAHRARAEAFLAANGLRGGRPLIGIHPGGGEDITYKRWPEPHFVELTRRLLAEVGAQVVLFGGPNEAALKHRIADAVGSPDACCADLPSFLDSAAVLERCRWFVTNDSVFMHVAAALGVPLVAIWGPTVHSRTRPWEARCAIVQAPTDCSPCLRYPFESTSVLVDCPRGGECLAGVSVDAVLQALMDLISASESPEPAVEERESR